MVPILHLFNACHLTVFLALFINTTLAQSRATLSIVVNRTSTLFIDGEKKGKLEVNKPFNIQLPAGEHYVQAKSVSELAETGEIIHVGGGKQKTIKLELPPPADQTTISNSSGANAIIVANLTFTIPGAMEVGLWKADHPQKEYPHYPKSYYAFEKGDEIIIDFTMENSKGTNAVTISTYPGNSVKYSNASFSELKDLRVKVEERSIYKFEFATNHVLARKGKMTIKRIPASTQTCNFNCSVTPRKIYTTTVVKAVQQFYIHGSSNDTLSGERSRVTFPVSLPPNTVEWYYIFSASRNEDEIKKTAREFQLATHITRALDSTGGRLTFGPDQFPQPPGADYCDIYLLDQDNFQLFEQKTVYRTWPEGTRESVRSGIAKIKDCTKQPFYIGIKKPDYGHGIYVAIEVVAVTVENFYAMDQK